MSMMQGWAKTVDNLMSRFEDTMKVLGIPSRELRDKEDPKISEPEQEERAPGGLPGRDLTDQAHASETLSKLRAQFQDVSCLLHESHPCSWVDHPRFCRGSQGLVECQVLPCHWDAGELCVE